jgi:hypothetical protein
MGKVEGEKLINNEAKKGKYSIKGAVEPNRRRREHAEAP